MPKTSGHNTSSRDDILKYTTNSYILKGKDPVYYNAIEDLIDHHNANYKEIREYQEYLERIKEMEMVANKKFSGKVKLWMKFKLLVNFWR